MLNGLIKYNIPIALLGNVRIANQYQVNICVIRLAMAMAICH